MPLDPDLLMNLEIPARRVAYDDRQPMLYALAVGAGADDLDLVYEAHLKVIPSFAQMLAFDDTWLEAGRIDLARVVHGGLDIRFDGCFSPQGEAEVETSIAGLTDKGEGRGGIVLQEMRILQDGKPVATSLSSLFLRGGGGFGGSRGQEAETIRVPDGAPEAGCEVATARNQALLFRLLGDRNPLHADPEVARAAGFDAPILHGASTFGLACLTVLRRYCGGDPARLSRFAGRFTGPVYPGETLVFSFWPVEGGVLFRVRTKERGSPVLDGGLAQLRD